VHKTQPVYLSSQELRSVQLTELEMLKEVHKICEKHGINYFAIGGTVLGAVRHKGFIPWDDDIDIAFLRKDYEAFRAVMETELNKEKFYFQDQKTEGYRWGYGKIRCKGTEFVRFGQEHMPYEQGIFIDIMPLDFIPSNYLLCRLHCFIAFLFRKVFWSEVGKYTSKGLEKFIYKILNKIPEKWLKNCFEKFIKLGNRRQSNLVRILTLPCCTARHEWGYKLHFFENISNMVFENFECKTVANIKEFLEFEFGNYMKLPPEDKRKTHPVSRLKLRGSFI
jgi:lipopolysaccharide cholinephosphotransferase